MLWELQEGGSRVREGFTGQYIFQLSMLRIGTGLLEKEVGPPAQLRGVASYHAVLTVETGKTKAGWPAV